MGVSVPSTALLTDRYELTMLDAAISAGYADAPACFEVFSRSLPTGRRYGVVSGVSDIVAAVKEFRFDANILAWLTEQNFLSSQTLHRLAAYRFDGKIYARLDGDLYFPHSPVLSVEASYGDALILETLLLSILNHGSAVASAASRMRQAAGTRTLIEMGGRRTHPVAAAAAAYAAYAAGFDATSNLAAGQRYGIPTAGTVAHAAILAAVSERAAFDAQIATLGGASTFLVDTFDIATGIRHAVEATSAAGVGLGAIRIDSGDPLVEVPKARQLLDALGASSTKITLTGDLDEFTISRYRDLPVDTYGVGTSVVTGSGFPTAGFVYKLVAIQDVGTTIWRNVAKNSSGKVSQGGRKRVRREVDVYSGYLVAEGATVFPADIPYSDSPAYESLQVCVFDGVDRRAAGSAADAKARHASVIAKLHPDARRSTPGLPAVEVFFAPGPV